MTGLAMHGAVRSVRGRRANNEDAVFCSPLVAAVADGVGGAVAGEVASRWAINEMIALDNRRLDSELDVAFTAAVGDANATLRFLGECRPEWRGVGTTLSAVALSNEGDYVIANVGDSRAYLLPDGRLRQRTRDGSLVQTLIDRGAITAEQARTHPQRSLVLEVLDGGERATHPPAHHPARAGDRLLLCSDGVSDYLSDEQIAGSLSTGSPDAAADALVGRALDAGSRDNVAAIVVDVVTRENPSQGWLDAL